MSEGQFDLPRYFICGLHPVKVVRTEDGGMDVLAYDWQTGDFERKPSYLERVLTGFGEDREIEHDDREVAEDEFEQHVRQLRLRLGKE